MVPGRTLLSKILPLHSAFKMYAPSHRALENEFDTIIQDMRLAQLLLLLLLLLLLSLSSSPPSSLLLLKLSET